MVGCHIEWLPPMKRRRRIAVKLGPRFERALVFATRKHGGQERKGTPVPYVSHLLGVAGLVLEAGGDEDLAIAALLHDVAEDCGGIPMLNQVRRRFGKRVAHIVEGCSDAFTTPKPPWRERKEPYISISALPMPTPAWYRRRTSCTTPAPSSPTIVSSENKSGNAFRENAMARCGTTARYWTNSSERNPIAS